MRREGRGSFRLTLLVVAGVVSAVALVACGSGGSDATTPSSSSGMSPGGPSLSGLAGTKPDPSAQQMGGTLNLISAAAWAHLDPGTSYSEIDYMVVYATQTPLYMFDPVTDKELPLLASGPARISPDGKTVTVHIKSGFHFSPPVDRAVTSADVAYAFQRDFNPHVENGYAGGYFPIVGAAAAKGKPIPGITTPDKTTIIFHLTKPFGRTFVEALALPGSAPVPESYAAPMDKSSPSQYDRQPTKQAFTGPYMIQSYTPDRQLILVRNPNWNRKLDGVRPAYADKIVWNAGADPTVAARQTLDSTGLLMADPPPGAELELAYQRKRSQLAIARLGMYWASLNTQVPPFSNIDLRKAVIAAQDREAYLLATGGKLVGTVATHFIYPEMPGFSQAGGYAGLGQDYISHPRGDMAVACKYMMLAGYKNCKYTGGSVVSIVGGNADPAPQEAQIVQSGLSALGFKTKVTAVSPTTMFSRFCGYVKARINVCPSAGVIEDFPDPYAALFVPFSGEAIVPINNSNWPLLNDPAVNRAIDNAAAITNLQQRYKAFAQADKMIVDDAPAIPEVWTESALLEGSKVHGVLDRWNDDWDLSFSSAR